MLGHDLPLLLTDVPGPRSRARVDVLARHECPAITARRARRAAALGAAHDDPIVWDRAVGANVTDVDGNRYVDLTAGFGVALVGHRHPRVVAAAAAQGERLVHAMGDAFPDATRIALLERLAAVAPPGLEVAILGLSGSDAVEVAVKTAILATGRAGVLAFSGGYHGLALGAVALQGYQPAFTAPFRDVVHPRVTHLPWGAPAAEIAAVLGAGDVGLVLVEPVQGRGGMRAAPSGWHAELAALARRHGALVAHDEIFTGLGRTGTMWAGAAEAVVPDLLCIGKALGGGWPMSACLGTRAAMDAWGASTGEAIHTQTFLGHPIGCAAAVAVLDVVADEAIPERARAVGARLARAVEDRGFTARGRGLMLGVRVPDALAASRALLRAGFIVLPAGASGDVLGVTPPATLSDAQADAFVDTLVRVTR